MVIIKVSYLTFFNKKRPQKVHAMAIEIGFIDYQSRFHISRDFYFKC